MLKNEYRLKIPRIIFLFVFIKLMIHLYTNNFGGYGIFRDELYLYACSLRLDTGYVDQPPLSVWLLKLITVLFGKSLFTIRFFAALFSAMAIVPIGLAVKELGGKKLAISIACIAYIISPIYLAFGGYYSMNSIDMLLWNSIIYLIIRLKTTQNPKIWLYLGLLMGMALLNKIGMLWFGLGLFIALLATQERHWLETKWPYLTASLALMIFLPYIWWNAQHDWATIEFLGSTSEKYQSENIASFLSGQLLIQHPSNIVVWIAGLGFYVFVDRKREGLTLFIIFLTILAILLFNVHSKPEYLAPIFTVLFIGGGLAIERWTSSKKWIAYLVIGNQAIGVFTVPVTLPILPVETYLAYADFIGIAPSTAEGHELSELPQFYADMFGWENQAKMVAEVYHGLSKEDKKKCAIFGDNYGRSGAIDYFSDQYDLPLSIGRHNNYWIWGPGKYTGELMLVCSKDIGDKDQLFEEVTEMGTINSKYAMPYENNLKIYLCRNLKYPINQIWPNLKNFN